MNNRYIAAYIAGYIQPFRRLVKSKYRVKVDGLARFIASDQQDVAFLLDELSAYDIEVILSGEQTILDVIKVEYSDEETHKTFDHQIASLTTILCLSGTTGISTVGLLVMQIIARIVCEGTTMYKAIILDLDDTLWKGTLAEEGIAPIKQRLASDEGRAYLSFMRFIRRLGEEMGLYVAICTHNNSQEVAAAIASVDEQEFPLKRQIDCILANHNDKSHNIRAIAEQLHIKTNHCVLIDDNPRVRDEVRQHLPEVWVPNWDNHEELTTQLVACCIFERFELSQPSRNRKRRNERLEIERKKPGLPCLPVKATEDIDHLEAKQLYAKANQFKLTDKRVTMALCQSLLFEMYSEKGENYGVFSTLTYRDTPQGLHISNWAISCGFFEFGVEEYLLLYIVGLAAGRPITFTFKETGFNHRAIALFEKYAAAFARDAMEEELLHFHPTTPIIETLQANTNLKKYSNG